MLAFNAIPVPAGSESHCFGSELAPTESLSWITRCWKTAARPHGFPRGPVRPAAWSAGTCTIGDLRADFRTVLPRTV